MLRIGVLAHEGRRPKAAYASAFPANREGKGAARAVG
jgi:hypothetical protein